MNPGAQHRRLTGVGKTTFSFLGLPLRYLYLIMLAAVAAPTNLSAQAPATPSPAPPHHQGALVGYFPQWGLYNDTPYTVKSLVASGGAKMLDQLNYAQGFVTGGHCSVADPSADLNYIFTAQTSVDGTDDQHAQILRGNFHQLQELKRLNPHLRIVVSLEGRGSDFAADAQPDRRAAFVASCVDLFLRGNLAPGISAPDLFDGIDLDWEYPRGIDAQNYIPLLEEFRRQMDAYRPGLLLTVALDSSPGIYGTADINHLGRLVDRAGLMTYDFNGPWSATTGFIAPLTSSSPDEWSVERSVNAWIGAGIPAAKLLVGLPFYGYGWHSVPDVNHGFRQEGRPVRGDRPYSFFAGMLNGSNLESPAVSERPAAQPAPPVTAATPPSPPARVVYRDPVSQAAWLFDGDSFWTYEDPTSIRSKANLVGREQLGGFMVWELSQDTPTGTLLAAAHAALLSAPATPGRPQLSQTALGASRTVSLR